MSEDDITVKVNLDATGFQQGVAGVRGGVDDISRSISRMASNARRSVADAANIFTRLDLAQIAVQQSTDRVAQAQEAYNNAVGKFGAGSAEAIKASYEFEKAQDALAQAHQRSQLSMALVGAQSVQLAGRVPAAVSALVALRTSATGAAFAMGVFNTTITLGAAAIGIAAGIAALSSVMTGFGADAAATGNQVRDLRQQSESLRHEWEEASKLDLNPFDGSKNARQLREELVRTNQALRTAMQDAVAHASQFIKAEDLKAELAAKNEAVVRSEALKTAKTIEDLRARLTGKEYTEPGKLLDLEKEFSDASEYAARLTGIIQTIEDEKVRAADAAQRAIEDQTKALQDTMSQGLSAWGVNLQNLSVTTLSTLSALDGPLGQLAGRMQSLKGEEEAFAASALRSSKALRDQAEITADKDETTEHFIKRLETLGYTEAEIAFRVDETGRALRRQADATRDAADAAAGLSSGGFGGGGMNLMGSDPLAMFLEANKMHLMKKQFGHVTGSMEGNWDSGVIAKFLRNEDIGDMAPAAWARSFVKGKGGKNTSGFINSLLQLIMMMPSQQWDGFLSQIGGNFLKLPGITGFAHGFEGIITSPGLFKAGEHGPESIEVRPLALDHGRHGGNAGNTFVFPPGSIVISGQQANDLLRHLQRLGVKA